MCRLFPSFLPHQLNLGNMPFIMHRSHKSHPLHLRHHLPNTSTYICKGSVPGRGTIVQQGHTREGPARVHCMQARWSAASRVVLRFSTHCHLPASELIGRYVTPSLHGPRTLGAHRGRKSSTACASNKARTQELLDATPWMLARPDTQVAHSWTSASLRT